MPYHPVDFPRRFARPGGPKVSAEDWNRLQDLTVKTANFRASQGFHSTSDGSGIGCALDLSEPFWAKITGNNGGSPIAYSWVQVIDNGSGGFVDDTSTYDTLNGSTVSLPAYEVNGLTVDDGTIVYMQWGYDNYLYFTIGGGAPWGFTAVTLSTSQNNYNYNAFTNVLVNASSININITGFLAGLDGQWLIITSTGTHTITLTNEDASSVAANRIDTVTGSNLTFSSRQSVGMQYVGANARWQVIFTPGGAGSCDCSSGVTSSCTFTYIKSITCDPVTGGLVPVFNTITIGTTNGVTTSFNCGTP